MKSLILLFFVLSASLFAQRHGGFSGGHPSMVRPPAIVRPGPVIVAPRGYYGGGYYAPFYGSWFGFGYPGYSYGYQSQPNPCKKEKLKDASGVKHEVLVCPQSDGTVKIFDPSK